MFNVYAFYRFLALNKGPIFFYKTSRLLANLFKRLKCANMKVDVAKEPKESIFYFHHKLDFALRQKISRDCLLKSLRDMKIRKK